MEYPYFPDHNVSPTIVIMKDNIEEGGVSVAKGRDWFSILTPFCNKKLYFLFFSLSALNAKEKYTFQARPFKMDLVR